MQMQASVLSKYWCLIMHFKQNNCITKCQSFQSLRGNLFSKYPATSDAAQGTVSQTAWVMGAQTRYLKPLSPSSLSLLNHLRLYIPEATQRLTNKWRPSCLDFLFQFLILMIQILAIEVIILRWIDTRGWRSQKQILQSRKDAQLYHLCQKIKLNREKIIF